MNTVYTTATMAGKRYGKLVVLEVFRDSTGKRVCTKFRCRCDCGNVISVRQSRLFNGSTKCCVACYDRRAASTKHGYAPGGNVSRVYRIWTEMRRRVNSGPERVRDWKAYGSRGIKVCDHWKDSFRQFLDDMGEPPTDAHSLDRIDPNGDYCPENCRWATSAEQAQNRRKAVLKVEYKGQMYSIYELASLTTVKRKTLWARIVTLGWPVEKALRP